jgi:defect in organelle trafficking protein DotC
MRWNFTTVASKHLVLSSVAAAVAVACALSGAPAFAGDMSLDDIANLSADSVQKPAITPARASILKEAAMALGSRKGTADRSAVLVSELEARGDRLDKLYRFGALVTKSGVLPPVITEARDAVESTSDQLRVADRMYRIVARSRLITTPPSWRDYLFVGLRLTQGNEMPAAAVLPKNDAERAYWKEQVMLGYEYGKKLADQILASNRARLDRDYMGMLRYSELLNKGMVSEPMVAVAPAVVSGDRNQINVGDTLYRVTDHGGFVTDAKKWQPVVEQGASAPAGASQ